MVNVLLIYPYAEIRAEFEPLIQRINKRDDVCFETTHIVGTMDDLLERCDADIIIARGITCKALRHAYPEKPMVEIQMTSFDMINAVMDAVTQFHPRRIALLYQHTIQEDFCKVEKMCGTPIAAHSVDNEENILRIVEQEQALGADVFIGGLTLCRICDQLEVPRVHIKSSPASIHRAIEEALNAAHAMNLERAKGEVMRTVLNNAEDALLALDRCGKVTALNNQAYLNFHLHNAADIVGHGIRDVCADIHWKEALRTKTETEQLITVHGKLLLVKCKPIQEDRSGAGVLVTASFASRIQESETRIRKELSEKGLTAKYSFEHIIGTSPKMLPIFAMAKKYAGVDANVLLLGETGTGKELFAHSIHNASKRRDQPFVALNSAAFPENLLESELFGYVEGAFSGAAKGGKMGLFELAHRGTIFLDEIGEVPLALQAKLLRVLQEKEIRRIGDDKVRFVDVRVISATNMDLYAQVAQGSFRSDLHYRLNLLTLKIPPLRERREDILELTHYFLRAFARDHASDPPRLTPAAELRLNDYRWPGNARELRNVCERLVVMFGGESVDIDTLEQVALFAEEERAQSGVPPELRLPSPRMTQEEMAKMLGVSRTTLWRRSNERNKARNN